MFNRFLQVFHPIPGEESASDPRRPWPSGEVRGFRDLMTAFAGRGFNGGLYRLHSESTGLIADRMVLKEFPGLKEPAYCFGYAWNGMQLALDGESRDSSGEPLVVLLDPSDGNAFEIDRTFQAFHNEEIVDDPDNSLDSELFDSWSWANQHALPLKRNQIVAYKIPLALGGRDTIENMEVIDFEVEWALTSQIRDQSRDLPEGTPIRGVRIP